MSAENVVISFLVLAAVIGAAYYYRSRKAKASGSGGGPVDKDRPNLDQK